MSNIVHTPFLFFCFTGLVLEGNGVRVWNVRPLHRRNCEHRGGRHLHADHEQHCPSRLSDYLQLHRVEQLWL